MFFVRYIYELLLYIVVIIFYSIDVCWLDFVGLYLIVFDVFLLICYCKSVIDVFLNFFFIVWYW